MSKIVNNPIMEGSSGRLGNVVVYRTVRGQLQMVNRPKRGRKFSDDQEAVQSAFQRASKYASEQLKRPDVLELYKTGMTVKKPSAYTVAMSDFLNAPVIHGIDLSEYHGVAGDIVRVVVTDDFAVTRVRITILSAAGVQLESGEATKDPDQGDHWIYRATVASDPLAGTTVKVEAFDRPLNKTVKQARA